MCGPLCGYGMEELKRESVWALYYPGGKPPPAHDPEQLLAIEAKVDKWLDRPRK